MKAVTSEEAEFLPLCLCAAQLATLTTDFSSVYGDPETTESAQTLLFRPLTHLTDTEGQNSAWYGSIPFLHSLTNTHRAATSGLQVPTQGPQIDLGRAYEPQNVNLLLEKWSKSYQIFKSISDLKEVNPLYDRVMIKTKNLNNEMLGTPRRLKNKFTQSSLVFTTGSLHFVRGWSYNMRQ